MWKWTQSVVARPIVFRVSKIVVSYAQRSCPRFVCLWVFKIDYLVGFRDESNFVFFSQKIAISLYATWLLGFASFSFIIAIATTVLVLALALMGGVFIEGRCCCSYCCKEGFWAHGSDQ